MAASAIACPGCGDAVQYGRLSCPSCGELLALVAGGSRRPAGSERTIDPARTAEPLAAYAPDVAPPAWPAAPMPGSLVAHDLDAGNGWGTAQADDAPLTWAQASEPDDETPVLEPEPEPYPVRSPAARWGAPAPADAAAPATSAPGPASWSAGPAPTPEPSWPAAATVPTWPAPAAAPEPSWPVPQASATPFEAGPPIEPTGAYPPGSTFAAAGAAPANPSAHPASPAGSARSLPALDLSELGTSGFQERVIVIGGAIATVAFFLPWASAVIGSPPLPDPWDSFGIVGAWHLIPFLLTVGTVALSQFGSRFPAWFRLALVPLATAGLLLGLDWYYLVTPLGGWLGGYVLAAGALVMAFGAVLALRSLARPRNAETPPSV